MDRMGIILIYLILLLPISASAETGIVLNASDYVQYKYDTETRPTLQPGEYIVTSQDINSVLRDAKYDGGTFVNPVPPMEFEEIELTVRKDPINPTQTIISGLAGAGAAYLVVRRKKP